MRRIFHMMTVQFYSNPYNYPDFKPTLTASTNPIKCTPKGLTNKGGTLHISGAWGTILQYNYMKLTRNKNTFWAWIDDVSEHGANAVIVKYTTDTFRTFKEKLILGTQYVLRHPYATDLKDDLLGSLEPAPETTVYGTYWNANKNARVLVVQATSEPAWLPNNTPVQPTPYHFYFCEYDPTKWITTKAIVDLLNAMRNNPETQNIITMYSIPYMDLTDLAPQDIPLMAGRDMKAVVSGFKMLNKGISYPAKNMLTRDRKIVCPVPYKGNLSRVNHSVQVIIPDAGIMNVPDDILALGDFWIRQDVDLFSGASNYMLLAGSEKKFTGVSVRGSSISSIPIISDPFETYISQNQNALATSLIGDVANVGIGAGMFMANPAIGIGQMTRGVGGLVATTTNLLDQKSAIPSNPPAFLGTALANDFNDYFYVIVKKDKVDNGGSVHMFYGYPVNMIMKFSIPDSGFIQTQNCSVGGDGSVPKWALEEINTIFDNGLRVRA